MAICTCGRHLYQPGNQSWLMNAQQGTGREAHPKSGSGRHAAHIFKTLAPGSGSHVSPYPLPLGCDSQRSWPTQRTRATTTAPRRLCHCSRGASCLWPMQVRWPRARPPGMLSALAASGAVRSLWRQMYVCVWCHGSESLAGQHAPELRALRGLRRAAPRTARPRSNGPTVYAGCMRRRQPCCAVPGRNCSAADPRPHAQHREWS